MTRSREMTNDALIYCKISDPRTGDVIGCREWFPLARGSGQPRTIVRWMIPRQRVRTIRAWLKKPEDDPETLGHFLGQFSKPESSYSKEDLARIAEEEYNGDIKGLLEDMFFLSYDRRHGFDLDILCTRITQEEFDSAVALWDLEAGLLQTQMRK